MSFSRPEDLHATFSEAMRAQDVEALLDLYEPNAIVALPDGSQITGPDALRGMLAGLVGASTTATLRYLTYLTLQRFATTTA